MHSIVCLVLALLSCANQLAGVCSAVMVARALVFLIRVFASDIAIALHCAPIARGQARVDFALKREEAYRAECALRLTLTHYTLRGGTLLSRHPTQRLLLDPAMYHELLAREGGEQSAAPADTHAAAVTAGSTVVSTAPSAVLSTAPSAVLSTAPSAVLSTAGEGASAERPIDLTAEDPMDLTAEGPIDLTASDAEAGEEEESELRSALQLSRELQVDKGSASSNVQAKAQGAVAESSPQPTVTTQVDEAASEPAAPPQGSPPQPSPPPSPPPSLHPGSVLHRECLPSPSVGSTPPTQRSSPPSPLPPPPPSPPSLSPSPPLSLPP
eukprot:5454379-Pleurochrysis_carterae.AAC.1